MCSTLGLSSVLVLVFFTAFSGSIYTGTNPAVKKCLPNVIGKDCDSCKDYHWNTSTPAGCLPCDCYRAGSYWEQCSEGNGQCHCKPGYGGRKCNQCLDSGDPTIICEKIVNQEESTSVNQTTNIRDATKVCSLPDPGNRLFCPYQCPECSLNPYSTCSYPSRSQDVQAIRVECIPGYGLVNGQSHTLSVCIDKAWVPTIPDCQKVCPPLESEHLTISCFNELTEVNCRQSMIPGTSATFKCRQSHKEFPNLALAGLYRRNLLCRSNGQWSGSLPECEAICGVSKGNDTLTPTIVDGKDTKLGQFPWHAALYRRNDTGEDNWDNICGGSLITNRVVLTAAHCVVLLEPRNLRVALGKYYRTWAHEEGDAVKRNIISIKLPSEYKGGATSYTWDIALLLMNASVQFNSFVMPVCMNHGPNDRLTKGNTGYVVGWGETAPKGQGSEVLLYNLITIMSEVECRRSISLFLTFDKFCGSKKAVSVVQKGDSGGGLTSVVGGLHYIFGVVSTKSTEIPMFTNISWDSHKRWISKELLNIVNVD